MSQSGGPVSLGTLGLRKKIEAALGRWGGFVFRNAFEVVVVTLAVCALLGTQLRHFHLDTTIESHFHAGDPVLIDFEAYQDLFGRDATVIVALKPTGGVFTADFLEKLRTIHAELEEEVPLIEELTSLVNVRETVGDEAGLVVDDFLERWPEGAAELEATRARALGHSLYPNYVVTPDGSIALIILEVETYRDDDGGDVLSGFDDEATPLAERETERVKTTGADDIAIYRALETVLGRHGSRDLEYYVAGPPMLNAGMSIHVQHDMGVFMGLSIAVIALLLAVVFRRIAAVLLPLVTVVLSVLMTLSIMGLTGTPLMPPSQGIPSLLLAIGIGGAVHLLAIFYQARRRGAEKRVAIVSSLTHSGLPIIMTSLTTAGGLVSFMPAALAPVSHFGWVTPVGVLLSLLLTLTLLPAMIALTPMRTATARRGDSLSQRALVAVGVFSHERRGLVLVAWVLLVGASALGLQKLVVGNDMVKRLPSHDPLRQSIEFINDHAGGAANAELLIRAESRNALHDPELLRKIERIHEITDGFEHSGIRAEKVVSIVDVVKETHRALNENRDDYYAIPDRRELVAQELLLFENSGSDDVEDLVTPQYDVARISIRLPLVDASFYTPFMDAYLEKVRPILGPSHDIVLTGSMPLLGRTVTAALDTMLRSYAMAFVVITLLMIVLIGSLRIGLIAMLPNLVPVVFALGLMGWLGISIDMVNLMLGSIIIGIAVDDTIHFMHNFRRELEDSGDVTLAIANTLRGTGQALLFTSFVLASGFLVYTQAYLDMLYNFGLLTAAAIGVAFLADVTLVPALVGWVKWSRSSGD